jgi:hypothetical protein
MLSSGMLRLLALVRIDVSEELSAPFIRVRRIGELGTMLVTASIFPSSPIHVILMKGELSSSETSVLTRAARPNISEDTIPHSGSYECCYLLGYSAVKAVCEQTFRKKVSLPSSGSTM